MVNQNRAKMRTSQQNSRPPVLKVSLTGVGIGKSGQVARQVGNIQNSNGIGDGGVMGGKSRVKTVKNMMQHEISTEMMDHNQVSITQAIPLTAKGLPKENFLEVESNRSNDELISKRETRNNIDKGNRKIIWSKSPRVFDNPMLAEISHNMSLEVTPHQVSHQLSTHRRTETPTDF